MRGWRGLQPLGRGVTSDVAASISAAPLAPRWCPPRKRGMAVRWGAGMRIGDGDRNAGAASTWVRAAIREKAAGRNGCFLRPMAGVHLRASDRAAERCEATRRRSETGWCNALIGRSFLVGPLHLVLLADCAFDTRNQLPLMSIKRLTGIDFHGDFLRLH